jgi:hypothetical protein
MMKFELNAYEELLKKEQVVLSTTLNSNNSNAT